LDDPDLPAAKEEILVPVDCGQHGIMSAGWERRPG
jgi:hypothetical protein